MKTILCIVFLLACNGFSREAAEVVPYMIGAFNDGMHDFGYPCSLPRHITIENLIVEDLQVPENYTGMYFFSNHDNQRS